jgi:hypothetical protein
MTIPDIPGRLFFPFKEQKIISRHIKGAKLPCSEMPNHRDFNAIRRCQTGDPQSINPKELRWANSKQCVR